MEGTDNERETASNAYVQLASELRSCMAFEPKKWRNVLTQSTAVLYGQSDAAGVAVGVSRNKLPLDKRRKERVAPDAYRKRPRSREEDDGDEPRSVALPRLAAAVKPPTATPSLSQYLNQPRLVDEILKELADHDTEPDNTEADDVAVERDTAESETEAIPVLYSECDTSVDAHDTDTASPRLRATLPILSTVSPRTRDGLARLPALSVDELKAIDELERLASSSARRQSMYKSLLPFGDDRKTPSRGFRHRKMATTDPMTETQVETAKFRAQNQSPWKKRAALTDPTRARDRERAEMIRMALEDVNAQCLQISPPRRFAAHAFAKTASLLEGLPPGIRVKLEHDHQRLVQIQELASADVDAAEARLGHTLQDIKQWIPLDVLYAFGLGKFASPAQQRAADVLFRVGLRLKNNLVVQAMGQWKLVVADAKRVAVARSTIILQCWWRQVRALREAASRRRIRRELERRQRAMLLLLASKENKSACTITRAIRRHGMRRQRERREQLEQAARTLQRFWRQQQAAWIALRHHIRQEQRRKAATALQRIARGFFARRRRRLLECIKRVDELIALRARERQARGKARHRMGAVLVIQRAFRAWVQRRVVALRRRRAHFERDKANILRVQAHYRGRRARKWAQSHRQQFNRAILVIQCAWRCYQARRAKAQVVRDREAKRDAEAAAFAERQRLRKARVLPLPTNLNKAAWGSVANILTLKTGKKDGGPTPKEVAAATRIQALWRGMKLRRRLKREHARERELARRRVNRRRRAAATCIQRHVRGIQGRRKAWHMMVHRSAAVIQGAWRGFVTRRELFRMRAALRAIMKMQCRWRVRRKMEIQGQRNAAARRIQRGWRRWMGKTWLYKAVRRQQYQAEEHAMGIALMKMTRKRVSDDLLLQSFIHRDVQIVKQTPDLTIDSDDEEDIKSVERSLYKLDSTKKVWKRRGYDGIWQELYRDASGNSFEIDNSHFARFLKAMPRGFINQRNFPVQTVDLIFAKMKEPKSRTITFSRFNKAMAMVWQEKFTPSSKQGNAPPEQSPDGLAGSPNGAKRQLEQDHFLTFMHDYVLPSTLQNGKYRKLLEESCTNRLAWAANVLRRFANRIAGKERHHKFIIVYRQHKLEQLRVHAAQVLQRHYRLYKFRSSLKTTLAQMFIEYIDYKGRPVRFEHIETKKVISVANRRPAFLRGVRCQRMIPLPFPGEEFHAFCERHESATDPHKKVPATIYCIPCEDPMCATCFARDHDKRPGSQTHEQCAIGLCSHCSVETATRECLQCGDGKVPFCDACFPFVHKKILADGREESSADEKAVAKDQHRYRRLVVACVECDEKVAQWMCDTCEDMFCKRCLSKFHAKGQRQSHPCHRLSYFSILKQKAESKRRTEAQKLHDQKRRERDARRAEEERVRKRREASATRIQAWTRSFQVRQRGKAYMKLVRQTNAAKAQRVKDEKKRSSLGYMIKSVFGLQPTLKSDTAEETEARRQRIESIKKTLFFYRHDEDEDGEADDKVMPIDPKTGKPGKKAKKQKKRWTKRARKAAEKAATTWLVHDMQVKIVRGKEWKDSVGSVLSTQNLFTTGHVLVFTPLANRAVVVNWEDITPYDEDEILRQPYVSPSQVAMEAAQNFRAKFSRFADATARRAKLMYLQSIEFHDVVQYAWVVEYNKIEQKEEFWNVVLNKRTFSVPKAMMLLERMEGEERDRVDARVALAKQKLVQLLHPFQPLHKPRLVSRRHAVVAFPAALKAIENAVYTRLRTEADALNCARFWHDNVVPHAQFGGKVAQRFLTACAGAPRSTQDCWNVMKLFRWIELKDTDAFTASAKHFFKKTPEVQMYIVAELADSIGKNDLKEAESNLERLLKLKEETIQLLISKADQEAAEAADKEKR